MSRRKRDPQLLREQCSRIAALLELTERSDTEMSRFLGHANGSTLGRVREGLSFLDSESLAKLGGVEVRELAHPNLHWLLTGSGKPFLPKERTSKTDFEALCVLALSEVRRMKKS